MTGPLAEVTERLMAEFQGRLSLAVVSDVVRAVAQDLADSPVGARGELLERSARQRLLDRTAQ